MPTSVASVSRVPRVVPTALTFTELKKASASAAVPTETAAPESVLAVVTFRITSMIWELAGTIAHRVQGTCNVNNDGLRHNHRTNIGYIRAYGCADGVFVVPALIGPEKVVVAMCILSWLRSVTGWTVRDYVEDIEKERAPFYTSSSLRSARRAENAARIVSRSCNAHEPCSAHFLSKSPRNQC